MRTVPRLLLSSSLHLGEISFHDRDAQKIRDWAVGAVGAKPLYKYCILEYMNMYTAVQPFIYVEKKGPKMDTFVFVLHR